MIPGGDAYGFNVGKNLGSHFSSPSFGSSVPSRHPGAPVADAFQDSEYFLPKIALQDQLGHSVFVRSSNSNVRGIFHLVALS